MNIADTIWIIQLFAALQACRKAAEVCCGTKGKAISESRASISAFALALTAFILKVLLSSFSTVISHKAAYDTLAASEKMTAAIAEYIGGIDVIKAFSQSAGSYKKYAEAVRGTRTIT